MLLTEFEASCAGSGRAVATVETLRVARRPALSAFTVPPTILWPLRPLAAARLLVHLIHTQLPQRLRGRAGGTGADYRWWRRRGIFWGALTHLGVAQFPRLLREEKILSVKHHFRPKESKP